MEREGSLRSLEWSPRPCEIPGWRFSGILPTGAREEESQEGSLQKKNILLLSGLNLTFREKENWG